MRKDIGDRYDHSGDAGEVTAIRDVSERHCPKVGTTQPTINRAAKGSDIRYVTGKAIECLYLQMTDAADIESAA